MKFRTTIAAGLSILTIATAPAHAALSGFHDSAEKINTILSSSLVADALRQAPIGMISNSGKRSDGADEWTITTQECDLKVHLNAIQPNGPGKVTYEIADIGSCD